MDAVGAYDLTKTYETEEGPAAALRSVNLRVQEGDAMACVGPVGSGKTTLIRLLAGLLRPTSGECSVLGLSPAVEGARLHSMIGTVLYSSKLYPELSLWDNLLFFARVQDIPRDAAVERASFLLRRLNLWEERDQSPRRLSTGMFKRASLARAMLHRPRVLLIDSQGAGMDLETADLVRELLRYAGREEGATLLLCTRDMAFAQGLCRSFGLLHKGTLMARGDLETLRAAGGVGLTASLRLGESDEAPEGFSPVPGARDGSRLWQRVVDSESEMPRFIMQAVGLGSSVYEARVLRPGLPEIYDACLKGGRRREAVINGGQTPRRPVQADGAANGAAATTTTTAAVPVTTAAPAPGTVPVPATGAEAGAGGQAVQRD